jgi:small-conductance mechanosensitive channel
VSLDRPDRVAPPAATGSPAPNAPATREVVAPEAAVAERAAETSEIVRTTGERVELGFWDALNAVLLRIPEILGFVLAILAGWFAGRLFAAFVRRRFAARDQEDLGRLLGTISVALAMLVFGLFALTLLFPSINPTNILSLLGVGSIALGFAFKDILQNLAAGVILLIREPYKKGDEIIIGDGEFEGVVEEVEMRATHIRTIDRRLIVIPNVTVFTNAITVNTDCDFRMTPLTLSIAYGSDPREAMEIVRQAIQGTEGVHESPAPAVTINALGEYSLDLYIVYAAGSASLDQIATRGAVLLVIHDALQAHGIALPFPTQVNLVRTLDEAGHGRDKLEGLSRQA